MLVTFKTSAYSDITMFGTVATALLKMMGLSGAVPGALMAPDIPLALDALVAALSESASGESADAGDSGAEANGDESAVDEDSTPVALTTRAAPLINLLEAAAAANENVIWES